MNRWFAVLRHRLLCRGLCLGHRYYELDYKREMQPQLYVVHPDPVPYDGLSFEERLRKANDDKRRRQATPKTKSRTQINPRQH